MRLSQEDMENLVGVMSMRVAMGVKLLPWPELPQDLAFIAFAIDRIRAENARLWKALEDAGVSPDAVA